MDSRDKETEERAVADANLRDSEAKYRGLIDSIDAGYCVVEVVFDETGAPVDYIFLETNAAFEKQTGLGDSIGKGIRALAPEHEEFWFETYGRIARTGRPERFEHRADALGRWYSVYAFRVGEPGQRHVAILFEDIKDRKRAEIALRESELRYRSAVRVGRFGSWETDFTTGVRQWSPEGMDLFGISLADGKGRFGGEGDEWRAALHPDESDFPARFYRAIETEDQVQVEYRIVRPDGQIVWLQGHAEVAARDAAGKPTRIINVSADITERKEADELLRKSEQRSRLLLAELQHRVRNTLAVVRSIARRTADSSETVEDYMQRLDGRLNVFSRTQALVTRDPTAGIDLEYLVAEELRAYSSPDGRQVGISGPHLRLQAKAAETMALVIHELATNALKYGALSTSKGKLTVSWQVESELAVLEWIEKDGPPPKELIREGFGAELLNRTLRYELDAKTDMEFPASGFQCRIALPLNERLFKPPA